MRDFPIQIERKQVLTESQVCKKPFSTRLINVVPPVEMDLVTQHQALLFLLAVPGWQDQAHLLPHIVELLGIYRKVNFSFRTRQFPPEGSELTLSLGEYLEKWKIPHFGWISIFEGVECEET